MMKMDASIVVKRILINGMLARWERALENEMVNRRKRMQIVPMM